MIDLVLMLILHLLPFLLMHCSQCRHFTADLFALFLQSNLILLCGQTSSINMPLGGEAGDRGLNPMVPPYLVNSAPLFVPLSFEISKEFPVHVFAPLT